MRAKRPPKRSSARRKKRPSQRSEARPKTLYLVLWWHLQRMYIGVFSHETEATLHAAARNGVVVELIGHKVAIGSVDDYWRRDGEGHPMPGEWRTSRVPTTA